MADWRVLYETLWKGRTFTDVDEAMENELEDKLNHPRLRKKPEVKFFEAVRRVRDSSLSDSDKMTLISAYVNCFEKRKQKD
ncbi:hypothetical protein NLX67_12025 [Domibacillus sp. A3M-37]|uniref:hypothetical protein n=1 Tax=Domibacillus TaxID=1433999 RepID=UPI000617B164|nr:MULTISPECIES: hypothetical protein [Domibacillus]MCP3763110.1 hypothetical protein [Domibacillus sp. A3M-37]